MGTTTDIPSEIGTSELVRDAYELLASKHDGQRQKVNGHPYVEHPIAVATDVSEAGFEPEMVAAALVHDIVEDSDVTVEDVRERFGDRVATLVDAMTDTSEVKPYERRKALHRERVVAAGPDAAAIFAADKLNNVRALRSAYAEDGEAVASRFVQPLDTKLRVWVAASRWSPAMRPPFPTPRCSRARSPAWRPIGSVVVEAEAALVVLEADAAQQR